MTTTEKVELANERARRERAVRNEFKGCITEIVANKTIRPKDDYNKGWNAGMDEAVKFIRNYIDKKGLFQS